MLRTLSCLDLVRKEDLGTSLWALRAVCKEAGAFGTVIVALLRVLGCEAVAAAAAAPCS